jgi:hypothetical protein
MMEAEVIDVTPEVSVETGAKSSRGLPTVVMPGDYRIGATLLGVSVFLGPVCHLWCALSLSFSTQRDGPFRSSERRLVVGYQRTPRGTAGGRSSSSTVSWARSWRSKHHEFDSASRRRSWMWFSSSRVRRMARRWLRTPPPRETTSCRYACGERERVELWWVTRDVERTLPSNHPRCDHVIVEYHTYRAMAGLACCFSQHYLMRLGWDELTPRPANPSNTSVARTEGYVQRESV